MQEFKGLMNYIDRMRERYFKALSAFHAYNTFREMVDPELVGESESDENNTIINKTYSNFFLPAKDSLRVLFLLELAKLYDISNDSLHINKIVNYTESNLKHLNVDAFREYQSNQSRIFLDELVKEYKGIKLEDVKEIRSMLEVNKTIIKKLKTYRDIWLAHDEVSKPELPDIQKDDLDKLFALQEKMLNLFSKNLDATTLIFDNAEQSTKWHVRMTVDHLRRFERYKLDDYKREQSGRG